MFDRLAKLVAAAAKKSAVSACGAASNWNICQPKEPAKLKELKK